MAAVCFPARRPCAKRITMARESTKLPHLRPWHKVCILFFQRNNQPLSLTPNSLFAPFVEVPMTTNTIKTDAQILVESVMQRHPLTITDDATVQDAVDKMTEYHLSALPVVDEANHLAGILTSSDLLRVMQDAERTLDSDLAIYDQSSLVTDLIRNTIGADEIVNIMSGATITVQQGENMQQVANLMLQKQVHHVPVVSKDRRLLGIISPMDFVRLVAERG
ncbi:Carnitine transport ATP-binding protein OpuCA [Roseimaritima ulvae]|uniref:Carnitine transport ATP-binding protein OpuCA n=2 Tax=Roseimaritima ulvae TaxID=980254 RepID=A0A5B9QRL5_9BACT|nr:Carnitine transport ATP-binding protein OpuCA [Roseimaritima ulvae]